jgi:hypothetical protein
MQANRSPRGLGAARPVQASKAYWGDEACLSKIMKVLSSWRAAESATFQSVWEVSMAIYRILHKSAFGPEEVTRMEQAYELALVKPSVLDRNDPITEVVAAHVVAVARTGEESALRICDLALEALRRWQARAKSGAIL